MGTVAELPRSSPKGAQTRRRILEVAQEAILAKGFDATSIEEIVAAAQITKSGFFYHFRDKNELARALLEMSIEDDRALLSDVFRRGHELSEDPLHAFLIGLKLFAEVMADMPNGHPAASSPPCATRSASSTRRCAPSTARWC
jgi:TetR/AcrR family transcriptional repressor of nem operon